MPIINCPLCQVIIGRMWYNLLQAWLSFNVMLAWLPDLSAIENRPSRR